MSSKVTGVLISLVVLLMFSCSALAPKFEHPDVKLVAIRLLPQHGLDQHIALDLNITNPNKKDLTIRSINYHIGIENIQLLSGATDQVPMLKSYQETPVTLEVSLDIIQSLRLIEHFTRNGMSDKVNYNFTADLDFSAWLPTMHVDKKGALPLGKLTEKNK